MDVREAIRTQPMRRMQLVAVAICLVLTMIDGFDILVMAFVAPHLAKVWQLGQVQVGYLLSAGVFGMGIGAVLLSPLADRIGRRRHVIICLSFITLGMALSATASSITHLVIYRAFAGLFIGALVASVNITVSEYSSDKRRGTVMGIYGIGFPLGAAIGGAVTSQLIAAYGWQGPFIFGAITTGIVLLISIFALPESIEYLIERRPSGALESYNKIADRLGYPRAQQLPVALSTAASRSAFKVIFSGVLGARTAFLWVAFACLTGAFYFANTWTPKLLADATGNPAMGVKAGVFVLLGGVLGALLFAALSTRLRPRVITTLLMFAGAVAFVAYANNFNNPSLALWLALLVGACANGGIAAYYAISPPIYPAAVRGAGVGWMIGFGRCVAITTPILTGYLLASGWKPQETYQLFAGVLVVAGIACLLLDNTYRGCSESPEAAAALA